MIMVVVKVNEGAVGDVEVNQGVCPSPRVVMIANDDEDDDDDE